MSTSTGIPLGPLTTFGVGGPAGRVLEVREVADFTEYALSGPTVPPLILGHGSNVVISADPESRSAGSFFLNPVVPAHTWEPFTQRAISATGHEPPVLSGPESRTRTSAGWLIEHAGFERGQRFGTARISRKHTLALVAEDGTTAADIDLAAKTIAHRVRQTFGIALVPEPRFVGPFER
ncbi:hypothetical protein [Streptosporangium sp. KLBMP 9127]|nr:hypothetical protein [Streptosporangium sp. KLBMP 9127]